TRFSRDWSSDVCSSDLATKRQEQACLAYLGQLLRRSLQIQVFNAVAHFPHEFFAGIRFPGQVIRIRFLPQWVADKRLIFIMPDRSEERRVGKECRSGG